MLPVSERHVFWERVKYLLLHHPKSPLLFFLCLHMFPLPQPSTLSLKARHTTAFWWPLYSLLISPVSTHHRRARLSEEAVGRNQSCRISQVYLHRRSNIRPFLRIENHRISNLHPVNTYNSQIKFAPLQNKVILFVSSENVFLCSRPLQGFMLLEGTSSQNDWRLTLSYQVSGAFFIYAFYSNGLSNDHYSIHLHFPILLLQLLNILIINNMRLLLFLAHCPDPERQQNEWCWFCFYHLWGINTNGFRRLIKHWY